MNIGGIICAVLSGCFLLLGLLFFLLKEKAAALISGFNTMPKEKQKLYDRKQMSKDQRNTFFIWAFILGTGSIFSYFFSSYAAIIAGIVWVIAFFRDVHLDIEKAFRKYKNN